MKKTLVFSILAGLLFSSSANAGRPMTNDDYFKIREYLRKSDTNDYKAQKVCEKLQYVDVNFTSQLIKVKRDGELTADMDPGLFSVPEITIQLSDTDQAADLKKGQDIHYSGTIVGCNFASGLGTLFLSITYARLNMHL